jgi:hypothetical protein
MQRPQTHRFPILIFRVRIRVEDARLALHEEINASRYDTYVHR